MMSEIIGAIMAALTIKDGNSNILNPSLKQILQPNEYAVLENMNFDNQNDFDEAADIVLNSLTTNVDAIPIYGTEDYLEETYSQYEWTLMEDYSTSFASGAIPIDIGSSGVFGEDVIDEAIEIVGVQNTYGGCGPRAMMGILDYFARFLGYTEISEDMYDRENQVQLAVDVLENTVVWNINPDAAYMSPSQYDIDFPKLLDLYGLSDKISCEYDLYNSGIIPFYNKKDIYLYLITSNVKMGLPLTIFIGPGKGSYTNHATNIYGYQKWIGTDSNNNQLVKYLIKSRLNWGRTVEYCFDDNILGETFSYLFHYVLSYEETNSFTGQLFWNKFDESFNNNEVTTEVYLDPVYRITAKAKRVACVEDKYLTLSGITDDEDEAYLELNFMHGLNSIMFDAKLYSATEGFQNRVDKKIFRVEIYDGNRWKRHVTYDLSKFSTGHNYDTYYLLFDNTVSRIRFYLSGYYSNGLVDMGRIILDNFVIRNNF